MTLSEQHTALLDLPFIATAEQRTEHRQTLAREASNAYAEARRLHGPSKALEERMHLMVGHAAARDRLSRVSDVWKVAAE